MADAPGLVVPQAELLLMATGLLKAPTRVHLRATRTFQRDLTNAMKAALGLEDPGRLYAIQTTGEAYWKKLQLTVHDYEKLGEAWEDWLGLDLSTQYQFAQIAARTEIEARHPSTTIDTVLGPKVVPNDPLSDGQWEILVATVEDHMRLIHDFAGGVLVSSQVQVMEMELSKLGAADEEWLPPLWLSDQIKVMRQVPLETTVDADAGKNEASPTSKGLDLKDQLRDMETTAERSSVA
jgi:hypothetical protein